MIVTVNLNNVRLLYVTVIVPETQVGINGEFESIVL